MTTMAVSLLIGGIAVYVGFLAVVLALVTVAKRADEAAERHARVQGACNDRLAHSNGELRYGGFTAADDVQFVPVARPARGGTRGHEPGDVAPRPPPAEQEGSWADGWNMG